MVCNNDNSSSAFGIDNSSSLPKVPSIPSIYFGGCAFGGAFYIGVYKALVRNWGKDWLNNVLIGGDSVGSILAIGLGLGKSPEYMENLYLRVSDYCLKNGYLITGSVILEKELRDALQFDIEYKQKDNMKKKASKVSVDYNDFKSRVQQLFFLNIGLLIFFF